MDYLLSQAKDVSECVNDLGCLPLLCAIYRTVGSQNEQESGKLRNSCAEDYLKVVDYLLKHGANPDGVLTQETTIDLRTAKRGMTAWLWVQKLNCPRYKLEALFKKYTSTRKRKPA